MNEEIKKPQENAEKPARNNDSKNTIMASFDRINWQRQLTKFQEIGKPFYVRFFRPTNIVDDDKYLNDDFNEIWRNEIW